MEKAKDVAPQLTTDKFNEIKACFETGTDTKEMKEGIVLFESMLLVMKHKLDSTSGSDKSGSEKKHKPDSMSGSEESGSEKKRKLERMWVPDMVLSREEQLLAQLAPFRAWM